MSPQLNVVFMKAPLVPRLTPLYLFYTYHTYTCTLVHLETINFMAKLSSSLRSSPSIVAICLGPVPRLAVVFLLLLPPPPPLLVLISLSCRCSCAKRVSPTISVSLFLFGKTNIKKKLFLFLLANKLESSFQRNSRRNAAAAAIWKKEKKTVKWNFPV